MAISPLTKAETRALLSVPTATNDQVGKVNVDHEHLKAKPTVSFSLFTARNAPMCMSCRFSGSNRIGMGAND